MKDVELPAASNGPEQAALAQATLPLWKAVGLGLAAMQVGPAFALAAGFILSTAGRGAWLSMVIAVAIMFCVAAPITFFARRFVVTGSLMSYVSRVLPPGAVLVTAASLFVGYAVATAALISGTVIFVSSTLLDFGISAGASPVAQSIAALLVTVFCAGFAYRGIDASIRVATILGFGSVPPLIFISIALLWRHPISLSSVVSLHGVSLGGVSRGVWLGISFFIGFDGLTSLAAETRDPLHNTPRILLWSLGGTAALALVACLIQTPYLLSHSAALEAGVSPAAILADAGGLAWIKTPVDILMIGASLASTVGYVNFGSRIIATTATDNLLPQWLAAIHQRYHTPHRAVLFLAFIGVGLPVVLQLIAGVSPLTAATYLTNAAAYNWALPYMLICVAAVVLQRREARWTIGLSVAAFVAFIAFGRIAVSALIAPTGGVDGVIPYVTFGIGALTTLYFYWMAGRTTTGSSDAVP